MEVYLQNLPPDLTDQGLKDQLSRYIKALSIQDWSCQKPRKRDFGFLTFLHPKDGERFLERHQHRPDSGIDVAGYAQFAVRLGILGNTVKCKRSNKAPDEFLLKSLVKSAEDRVQAKQQVHRPVDAKISFHVRSLSCGYYEYENGKVLAYVPEIDWAPVSGFVKFANRDIIIEFNGNGTNDKHRVEIPFRIVEAMTITSRQASLTLTLWEAPRLFNVKDPALAQLMAGLLLGPKNNVPSRTRLVELAGGTGSHREVLGQSLVYQICVLPLEFDLLSRRLHERGIFTLHYHDLVVLPSYRRRDLGKAMRSFSETISTYTNKIPFGLLFQMEALVRNGFLPPWTVNRLLEKTRRHLEAVSDARTRSARASTTSPPVTARAIKKLFSQIPFPGPDVDAEVFDADDIWTYIEGNARELQDGFTKDLISEKGLSTLTMVHKVNITPTGMTLHGPEVEAKNRLLRRFPDHTEYFIRVQFCEEDGSDLRFNFKVSNDRVYQRFTDVFKNGINIGGRVYGFLGFSHSSLRSHSAWFVAPFFHEGTLQTYFSIISFLGKFENITSPARCAARIGQAFSETPLAVSLSELGIEPVEIDDIRSRDGRRVFSDGVGTISRSVMEGIHAAISERKGAPTCFQIRWAGAKGMLSLDPRIQGTIMRVRPSMVKFESTARENLEICDTANKPIPMALNRQIIKLLEDIGVPNKWFIQQQEKRLRVLQLITAHIASTVHFLKRQNIASSVDFPRFVRRLENIGIDYRRDRFMSSVVEASVLRELRLLKHKAKIPVTQGVKLFGIMDETGYLEEGEVFVTFDKAPFLHDRAQSLDNRQMIITRSPALHPGDIQLATNVVPPDHHPLRSQRNCIVFSQKGERDLPSCLSGGDLDGDIYGIIWDQEAVRGCERLFQPADYPRAQQLDIGRTVKREDMYNFFIEFMATDQLGVIATKHMILADQKDMGTVDPDCSLLAEMHSTGVDYSKTGIPVDMTLLKKMKSNRYRPDFLAPAPPANIKNRSEICFDAAVDLSTEDADEDDGDTPNYIYYKSDKINGKLYQAIDEGKIWYQDIRISVDRSLNIWDELLRHIIGECNSKLGGVRWANAKIEAWEIRNAYEDAISNAALDHSDHATKELTEVEVFTGTIFNSTGSQTRRQRDGSIRLKDEFDRISRWTVSMIRKGSQRSRVESEDSLALSIACLEVGSLRPQRSSGLGMGRRKHELQSFRILAASCALKELEIASGGWV